MFSSPQHQRYNNIQINILFHIPPYIYRLAVAAMVINGYCHND